MSNKPDETLLRALQESDAISTDVIKRENIVRAPFAYAGGKSKSLKYILPYLPFRKSYIEPFGGSAAVLLAREPSDLEVYNDRFAGIVALYRCMRDEEKVIKLIERLRIIVHAREEFIWCRDTWHTCTEDVERAARWYYMNRFSFGSLGRNFGRATSASCNMPKATQKHVSDFYKLHNRMKNVLIENQDWRLILKDFDNHDAVFYLDPPYIDAHSGTYSGNKIPQMTYQDHQELLYEIKHMQGFVAISSYGNELYKQQDFWGDVIEWQASISIKPMAFTDSNHKEGMDHDRKREQNTECLYIKY